MTLIYKYNSQLGMLTLASDGEALTGIWYEGQKYFGGKLLNEVYKGDFSIFKDTIKWLDCYFAGEKPDFIPKLKLEGSIFRKRVWEILLTIPYGKTISYGEIAKIIGNQNNNKMSAQAVGGAVGHNPISIIVPCHRVVGKNGSLTGYAGGLDKKIYLLNLEGLDTNKFYMPKI